MAVVTYTSDLTDIFLFESTGSVSAWGGGSSGLGASADYAIEGTNAIDKKINNEEKGFMYDNTTNFSIGPNDHFFIWVIVGTPGIADTRDNRGIQVCIGDATSSFVKFHVNGVDTLPTGGHTPYSIRFADTALANRRTLVGTPGTTPSWIGCGANITATAKFPNLGADAARIGTGYDVLRGDGGDADADFTGIASDDESTSEGICQTAAGGFSVQGKIRVGNSTTTTGQCTFTDSNINLFLVNTLDGHSLTDWTEFILSNALSVWTMTNVNFIALGTNNPGRFEVVTPLTDAQDETSYDNSPTSEGTFAGGTGHAASDVITLDDDWTTVTVDAVSGGVVTQFTVDSSQGRSATSGTTITQSSTTGSGTGFTLTPDTDNIEDAGDCTFVNVGYIDFGETIVQSGSTFTGCRWIGCDQVTANGASFDGSTFTGYEGTANTSYMIWDANSDPDGELDNCSFTKGTAATHAIEFGENSPLTMTLTDVDFSGYNASNSQNDSTFHIKRTSGTVTINIVGGSGNVTYRSDGAIVDIVQNPVALTLTVTDISDSSAIESARVYITPSDNTGPFPWEESVSLTAVTTTATATHTAHGMLTGQKVKISGAVEDDYNGIFTITVTDANTYTYTMGGSPTSPATGTIIGTAVIIDVDTNASGIATDTRTYGSNQPITGRVRHSTTAPYYKTSPITGTIDSANGLSISVQMILDQ